MYQAKKAKNKKYSEAGPGPLHQDGDSTMELKI